MEPKEGLLLYLMGAAMGAQAWMEKIRIFYIAM